MSNTRPIEKPKNSRDQLVALMKAMRDQGIETFGMNSSYKPKWSAQSALRGKCHYVDDDALSFFNAKVNDAGPICEGLFYFVRESKDTSFDRDCREHDIVYFDVFGSVVEEMRQKSVESVTCSNAYELSNAPQRLFDVDVLEYYATRIQEKKKQLENEVENFGNALDACIDIFHSEKPKYEKSASEIYHGSEV